jgi:hypothetical protein
MASMLTVSQPCCIQDNLANNPTWTCSVGHSARTYDIYTGDSTYAQMQNSAYFKSTAGKNK